MCDINYPIEYTNKIGDIGRIWLNNRYYFECKVVRVYSYNSPKFGFYKQCCDVELPNGKISTGHFKVEGY